MPKAPARPCRNVVKGCPYITSDQRGFCTSCAPIENSKRASAHRRGYGRRWERLSKQFLRRHPICECNDCKASDVVTPSTVVDHIIPHRGDQRLFWDQTNWQAMAKTCHDRKTATEDGGFGR